MQNIVEIENKHTSGVYAKQTLTIVRGQGASLFDVDGNEYLDCSSGHGVANLGHAHPKIAEALYKEFVSKLRARGANVETGRFRAMMDVHLVNWGPVTLMLDSKKEF